MTNMRDSFREEGNPSFSLFITRKRRLARILLLASHFYYLFVIFCFPFDFLEFQVYFYWAVVATHNLCVYLGFCDLVLDAVGYQEVVDAPTGVLLSCLEAVGPP